MATSKLDLSNLSIVDNKFYVIDANKTNPKYAGNKVDSITNGKAASDSFVTFEDGSTLSADGKFTAGSGSGTFTAANLPTDAVLTDKIIQDGIAQKAAKVASTAVAKLASDADASLKAAAAQEALKQEAEKYDTNTIDHKIYLALSTVTANSGGVVDANGVVDVNKVSLSTAFGSSSVVSALTLTDLNFADASGAITANLSDSVTYGGITNVVGSDYADKLTLGGATDSYTVDAGDGNDTVNITSVSASGKSADINLGDGNDVLNIDKGTKTSVNVTLGDGADVVNIASGDASVSISDYNYADGDKINLTYDKASESLNAAAVALASMASGDASIKVGDVTATVAATDGVAVADITAGKDTVTFYTAVDAKQDVEINAKDISNKTIINAAAASTANITLGSGDSNVSLSTTSAVDTINATGAKNVTITSFAATDDILVLDGANLNNITLASGTGSASTDAVVTYGKTTVNLAGLAKGAASVGTIKLNDADTTLAYNLGDKGATMAAGADMYYGHADGNSTVVSSDTVHLADTDKFKNIYNVSVAGGSEAEKLDLSGFTTDGKHGINIDASKADVAVNVWAYNKSKAQDTITLGGTNNIQDTVSFVSDDGKVSVAGFGFGAGEESDILYLRDTQDLQKLNVKKGEMKIGSSQLDIGHAADVNDVMQLKLADGTSSLIAGNFDSAKAGVVNVTVGDDAIDFYALNGTKNTLSVAKGSAEDAVSFKYSNLDDNHTAKTLVKSVSVSDFSEEDDVTIGAVAATTVGGSGKTHIWVCGAADAGTVDISKSSGADQIDFVSGIDKKVTVTGYDADQEDTIFLRGSEDLKAVTSGYKFESKNGGVQISGVDNADSKLVLDGASNLNLKTTNGDALKAIVGAADATFASDTQIYVGMKKIEADTTTEGDIAVRVGTKGEIGLDSSSTYYVSDSVTEFDASNSNAVFHLAGSSTAATTLRGGNTENSFYGGGSFSDTMVGNSSAVDTFYFGKGDGKDTIQEADGKDTVYLMDVSVDDITIDTKTNTIAISTSDTLTFGDGAEDALTAGELTFNIGGSNYVCKDGKMVAKA